MSSLYCLRTIVVMMAVGPTKPYESWPYLKTLSTDQTTSAVAILRGSFRPTRGNVLKASNGIHFLLYLPTSALIRVQTYNSLA